MNWIRAFSKIILSLGLICGLLNDTALASIKMDFGASPGVASKKGFYHGQLLNIKKTSASIDVYSPFDMGPFGRGVMPLRLEVKNPKDHPLGDGLLMKVSRGWGRSRSQTVWNPLPFKHLTSLELMGAVGSLHSHGGSSLELEYRGKWGLGFSAHASMAAFAAAVSEHQELFSLREKFQQTMTSGSRHGHRRIAQFNLKAFLSDPRQLSGWEDLILPASEASLLKEQEMQNAMAAFEFFVQRGGRLWVVQPSGHSFSARASLPAHWGFVPMKEHKVKHAEVFGMGLGELRIVSMDHMNLDDVGSYKKQILKSLPSAMDSPFRAPVPTDVLAKFVPALETNIMGFMMMVIVFALLVGPLNLFVFCRHNRLKLMLTTPLLSMVSALFFALAIVALEGLGGTGARSALTFIDAEQQRWVTQQEQVVRTQVVWDGAFDVREIDVYAGKPIAGKTRASSLLTTVDDQATEGWFTSRNILSHHLFRPKLSRERVELRPHGEGWKILSTVAFPMEVLWMVDAQGEAWKAEAVQPNVEQSMIKVDGLRLEQLKSDTEVSLGLPKTLYKSSGAHMSHKRFHQLAKAGQPWFLGMSVAEDGFIPSLKNAAWDKNWHYVLGPAMLREAIQ